MTRDDDDDEELDKRGFTEALFDDDDGYDPPLGSCDNCGVDLHEGDDLPNCLCDQCSWRVEHGM